MRAELLEFLACPRCGGALRPSYDEVEDDEAITGELSCQDCERDYPLIRGVPRMNWSMDGLDNVARSFGYEWKSHHRGRLESETLFGRTLEEDWNYFTEATGWTNQRLSGATVLDGGCGSGRLTRQIGEHGAGTVIGVDINEAVDEAFAATRDLPHVHIVQGNIFALPFRERAFSLVWSNGVIHHTPDPARGHRALSTMVRPGGTLYVWVYPKRFNPFRFVKDVFDALRITRLRESLLFRLSEALSYPSIVLLWVYRALRAIPGLRPRTARDRNTVRRRSLRELQLTWFDVLSPEYDSRHREGEVIDWFRQQGFEQISALVEPKVGVRGVLPSNPG